MDYKNAIILSLGEKRKPHAYESHWDKKYLRPSEHSATCQELMKSTHLSEAQVVTTLNELEAEKKVKGIFRGGKECLILWWELV